MDITVKNFDKGIDRANKVYVQTKYSSDGHYTEGYWLSYSLSDPGSQYAMFLLVKTLNSSDMIEWYAIYDENGDKRVPTENHFGEKSKQI